MAKLLIVSLVILLEITSIMAVTKMQLIITGRITEMPAASLVGGSSAAAPAIAPAEMVHIRMVSRHHTAAAGGDVILGGFAFALVAAVICYIRANKKNTSYQSSA